MARIPSMSPRKLSELAERGAPAPLSADRRFPVSGASRDTELVTRTTQRNLCARPTAGRAPPLTPS